MIDKLVDIDLVSIKYGLNLKGTRKEKINQLLSNDGILDKFLLHDKLVPLDILKYVFLYKQITSVFKLADLFEVPTYVILNQIKKIGINSDIFLKKIPVNTVDVLYCLGYKLINSDESILNENIETIKISETTDNFELAIFIGNILSISPYNVLIPTKYFNFLVYYKNITDLNKLAKIFNVDIKIMNGYVNQLIK